MSQRRSKTDVNMSQNLCFPPLSHIQGNIHLKTNKQPHLSRGESC